MILILKWNKNVEDASAILLDSDQDVVSWKLENSGKLSVKSTYNALTSSEGGPTFKYIWKGKIPPKIKILLCLVANIAILTKGDMIKRNWNWDPICYFCQQHESVTHLLFTCSVAKIIWAIIATCRGADNVPTSFAQSWKWCEQWQWETVLCCVGTAAVCWSIWKMRNKVCFEGKKIT